MLQRILKIVAPVAVLLFPVIRWVTHFFPYFHIKNKDGSLYMGRYWLLKPSRLTGGWGIRLHNIVTSDDDRALHDHPWDFGSIILRGGYFEIVYETDTWEKASLERDAHWPDAFVRWEPQTGKRVVGRYVHRGASYVKFLHDWPWHRVRLLRDLDHHYRDIGETWTLFVVGPYKNHWGFRLDDGTKVPHREYIEKTYGKAHAEETDRELAKAWGGKRP